MIPSGNIQQDVKGDVEEVKLVIIKLLTELISQGILSFLERSLLNLKGSHLLKMVRIYAKLISS